MSSPTKENEEPIPSEVAADNGASDSGADNTASEGPRPPAKRPLTNAVIEISDTESDDSDVCAVTSYQASADEVKRIRGADYSSSSSSSSDYSSDSDSGWEDDSIVIPDDVVSKKTVKAMLYPRANRMEDPKLNTKIQSQDLIDSLKSHWEDNTDLQSDEVTLTTQPFKLCLLHNILSNPDIINNIVDDMNTLDWSRKKMDLFEFHQTMDLASLTWQRSIRGIYDLLKTEVMEWVRKVTGLRIESVSASCSLYGPGDHLLVHDDRLGDRRVAFILYLAPWAPDAVPEKVENGGDHHLLKQCEGSGWSPHMGGALDLFACNKSGPTEVVHSVYPRNNMLAFFQVSDTSFHQVSEVVSMELPRLSINGWFHGPADPSSAPDAPLNPDKMDVDPETTDKESAESLPESVKPHNDVVLLPSMLSTTYMSPRIRAAIQTQMERDSEVCLKDLLPKNKLDALHATLSLPDIPWQNRGPANRRRYSIIPIPWMLQLEPENPIREIVHMFSSVTFSRMLTDCSDLVLHAYENLEMQRWRPGDFTLLPSREHYQSPRLEAVFYILSTPEHLVGHGGSTIFVAAEESSGDGALAMVPPQDNALSLVYCEPGTARFTKYRSKLACDPDNYFYILTCTYKE